MRIVFFGSTELGYNCCEALIKNGFDIVAIFTIPETFSISYSPGIPVKNFLHKDFTNLANRYEIPIFYIDKNLNEFIDTFESLNPHFVLAVGWYYMFPSKMLNILTHGAAGLHASLLPKYRGNAPLVWAMINGEKETGVSFFYFEKEVDSGDIIAQEPFNIDEKDTIKDLLVKVQNKSIDILLKNLPLIEKGNNIRIKQEHNKATFFPKRTPQDGKIEWGTHSSDIEKFIRAQTRPYPGAFSYFECEKIIIWEAKKIDFYVDRIKKVGQIIFIYENGDFIVQCKNSFLRITNYESILQIKNNLILG